MTLISQCWICQQLWCPHNRKSALSRDWRRLRTALNLAGNATLSRVRREMKWGICLLPSALLRSSMVKGCILQSSCHIRSLPKVECWERCRISCETHRWKTRNRLLDKVAWKILVLTLWTVIECNRILLWFCCLVLRFLCNFLSWLFRNW